MAVLAAQFDQSNQSIHMHKHSTPAPKFRAEMIEKLRSGSW